MDAAHLHLIINHLLIVGVPFVAALLAWGILRDSREVTRTALAAAVVVAALAYPVFLTGEPAEEGIEHTPGFSEQLVHEHEERAEAALVAVLLTGVAAAGAFWMSRKGEETPRVLGGITLAALLVSGGLLGLTGLSGGQIAHDEIRDPLAAAGEPRPAFGAGGTMAADSLAADSLAADSLAPARDRDDDDDDR